MSELIAVSPFRCRMWQFHGRLDEHIDEETCRAEIDSFLSHGQQLRVLGRPLRGDKTHDLELVYGARRLFVARHLNVPLLIELRELTDLEAIIAIDIENRQRKELSAYERGRAYDLWIRAGLFSSQQLLARALKISPSRVSRLVRLAQLPPVIVGAFANPLEIRERWARNLMDLWSDPEKKRALTAAAEGIAKESNKAPADLAFKRLVGAAANARDNKAALFANKDEVVKDDDGSALFRVRKHRNDTAVLIPAERVSRKVLSAIKLEIAEILQREMAQVLELQTARSGAVANGLASRESLAARRVQRQLEAR